MKTRFYTFFLTMLSFLFCSNILIADEKNDDLNKEQFATAELQTLQIVTSPDLVDLTNEWLVGYRNLNPEQKITLSSQTETSTLNDGILYLFSSNNPELPNENQAWKMVVGHDLIVPVTSINNPNLNEINKRGFTSEEFAQFLTGEINFPAFFDGVENIRFNVTLLIIRM